MTIAEQVTNRQADPDEQTRARYPDDQGYIERDGVRVFYEVYGSGEPAILFCPTWTLVHSRVWKMQIPYLARHYRVVVFDPRGNGKSDRPPDVEAYAESEFAPDALDVLDATGTEEAIVAGLSRGTQRALLLAAEHPERVRGLVLIGPWFPASRSLGGVRYRVMFHPWVRSMFTRKPIATWSWAKVNAVHFRRDFRDFVSETPYDLWIGDEAWELDYHLHENPDRKRAPFAWLTDFVGWLQISHPGRQVQARMPGVAWAPSAVPVELGRQSKRFAQSMAMTEEQIHQTTKRFATAAALAERAGFDGVEVHAAHGYLLSQFLSPLVNKRRDRWGGPLENRARFLLDVIRSIRTVASSSFAVAVKLNSADFQRGGFDADDAARVIAMLEPLGVDLVELSGGSYESPAMSGRPADARTVAREAYFLELAAALAETSPLPLMLTGGISRRETAEAVLESGVAMVGIGTAIAVTSDLPNRWRAGREATDRLKPVNWSDRTLASAASMSLVRHQMRRITRGKDPTGRTHPLHPFVCDQRAQRRALGRYRAWLGTRV